MTWGKGPWGAGSPWGTGVTLPPPVLLSVFSFPPAPVDTTDPAVIARRGGTVCLVSGNNFFDPVTIDILTGGPGAYTVVATGYVFDPEFDVERNRVFFGAPALQDGTYSVRVTTDGGVSGVLDNVLEARLFAEEFKTLSVRGKFSTAWDTGPRILRET